MAATWGEVLDSLACQIDLQERALAEGHGAPPDLEIDPPDCPVEGAERLRAIELFGRCEQILGALAKRAGAARSLSDSAYGRTR